MDPDLFLGDLEGYLAWARGSEAGERRFRDNPSFCAEHWAPCPVEGRNGLVVSMRLMEIAISEMPDDVRQSPKKMNEWQEAQEKPTCCRLGDERMAELWAEAPRP